MPLRSVLVRAALGLCSLAMTSRAVLAQVPDTLRRDTAFVLPSLSVTAARHQSSPLRLPFAVTTVRTSEVQGGRGYGLEDALARVPGVLAQSRYGTSDLRLVIRGFGARGAGDRSNSGTTRGVRVLLDGFPETEPDGRTSLDGVDMAAIHSIEVIRSNASSLYGNAAGGVVSISTMPDLTRDLGFIETTAGSFGLVRNSIQGGARLGQSRIAGTVVHTTFDGWREHSDAKRTLANAAVQSELDPRTRLGLYAFASSNFFRIPGPLTQAQVDADDRSANATYLQRDERRFNRIGRLGATLEHDFSATTTLASALFVNPKFLQRSERGTFRDFTRFHLGGNAVLRQNARLSPGAAATLQLGFDEAYQDGAILFYSLTPEGTRGATLQQDKREGANNLGFFAAADLELGERWSLSAGARYDRITYYGEDFFRPALSDEKGFSKVTPKLAVNFRLSPTQSLYANMGGGIEAPAGNETDPASTFGQDSVFLINPLLNPIRSTTYEAGTKQILTFGGGFLQDVSYDLALYHTRVRDEIIPYRGGRFYFTAGKVGRTGAELGLSSHARNGLEVFTALTWSRNRYNEYLVDSAHYQRPGAFADYSGKRVVGVPDWIYNVTVAYVPSAWRKIRVQGALQGTSSYFADDANATTVPGYGLFAMTVGLEEPLSLAGRFGLRGSVSVQNLFDRHSIDSAFLNPDVVDGVPVAFEPGMPRTVVVQLSLGWR
jgi:iron complex outermembrane receptor protein